MNKRTSLPLDQAQPIAEKLASDQANIRTLRSFARLMLVSEGRAYRASVAVLLERPDRFRIEFLGPFRHPRHIVTFDGKTFGEIGKNNEIRLQDAQASGSTLSFLGLTPEWLVSSVLGLPLVSASDILVDRAFREGKSRIRLELKDDRGRITLWTRPRSIPLVVERLVFDPWADGDPVIEVSYSNFKDMIGQDNTHCRLPRIVTIGIPERRESLRISFSDPEVNAELDPAFFRIGS